jgi:acetyl esterase
LRDRDETRRGPGEVEPAAWAALHPQVRSLLSLEEEGAEQPADLAAERAAYLETALRLGGALEPVAAVEELVVPSGEARLRSALYVPQHEGDADALLLWLHGGGWYLGDIPGFERVARALANAAGAKVLLPEYRLAPEHPFPTPVDDAYNVLAWARSDEGAGQLGIDPERVVVGGDSAGGQLAAAAARRAIADGLPAPRAQLLAYPALDPAMGSDAYREFADGPLLSAADMERCWRYYLDGQPGAEAGEEADLLRAPVPEGMPEAFILIAGVDPLRDDGLRYAERLRAAGTPVRVETFGDMAHGFLRWGGVVDRAHEAIALLGEQVRAAVTR